MKARGFKFLKVRFERFCFQISAQNIKNTFELLSKFKTLKISSENKFY